MPWTTTNDNCDIYYEDCGSGPVVAFASGFMGITDIWRDQIESLSSDYRCISFDNRGNGRSEKPLPRVAYGVDRHADDLVAVLDAAGVDTPVVLVGHSMGGNTASTFALAHPERVAGIVYVGSYVSGRQIHDVGNTLEKIKAAVTRPANRVGFYRAVGLPEAIALESAKWPLYAVLGNAESFMRFDLGGRYSEITAPTLVLHGDRDIVSPLDPCGEGLDKVLPNSRLEVFPDVNHCPSVEAPERVTSLIGEHLQLCFG